MAFLVLTDAKVLVGAYNFSGYSNEIQLQQTADLIPANTFDASGTKKNVPGLRDFKGSAKGFMDYANIGATAGVNIDSILFGRIGATKQPVTVAPVGNAEGERAYGTEYVNSRISVLEGKVGDLIPWTAEFNAVGTHLFDAAVAAVGTKTATGQSGSAILDIVGGVLATERLFANLHVITVSGTSPTLNVIVQSATDSIFTSPTTRLSFTAVGSSVTSEHKSVAGAITDRYYRMKWTITGTSPSYYIYGVIGVQ